MPVKMHCWFDSQSYRNVHHLVYDDAKKLGYTTYTLVARGPGSTGPIGKESPAHRPKPDNYTQQHLLGTEKAAARDFFGGKTLWVQMLT